MMTGIYQWIRSKGKYSPVVCARISLYLGITLWFLIGSGIGSVVELVLGLSKNMGVGMMIGALFALIFGIIIDLIKMMRLPE